MRCQFLFAQSSGALITEQSSVVSVMKNRITKERARDAGLAMVLILLLVLLLGGQRFLLLPAILCLVLVMTVPAVFGWWARVWFGFSHLLGTVVSRVLLTVVFYAMAVPVGILRRLGGADPMRLKLWKQGSGSVFVDRNHTMTGRDIERPY